MGSFPIICNDNSFEDPIEVYYRHLEKKAKENKADRNRLVGLKKQMKKSSTSPTVRRHKHRCFNIPVNWTVDKVRIGNHFS
jgi:hypothetical protein